MGGCWVAQQHVPPAPAAPPPWGALSGAGTPHPAPAAVGGTGSVLCVIPPGASPASRAPHAAEAPALAHSWTGLTRRLAPSSPLPRVGPPPQGGVHPRVGCAHAAGQGHRSCLSHLAQLALPRRDPCRQPPDTGEELRHIQGVTVTESPPSTAPSPLADAAARSHHTPTSRPSCRCPALGPSRAEKASWSPCEALFGAKGAGGRPSTPHHRASPRGGSSSLRVLASGQSPGCRVPGMPMAPPPC